MGVGVAGRYSCGVQAWGSGVYSCEGGPERWNQGQKAHSGQCELPRSRATSPHKLTADLARSSPS